MQFVKQRDRRASSTVKVIQTFLLRLLSLILILSLAWLWVMLTATPALAQANTINYSNRNFENRVSVT